MSLRLRLSLAVVSLVFVALLVADIATYLTLQTYLIRRVDQQLSQGKFPISRALAEAGAGGQGLPAPPGGGESFFPPGTYGELLDQSGKTLNEVAFTYGTTPAAPSLPADVVANLGAGQDRYLNAGASGGSGPRYRVLVTALPGSTDSLVVAIPLSEVDHTLNRVLLAEALATGGALVGLGLLAWWIVRRELRPLEDMAVTAGEIAAGDLARRVEPAEPRTEVGRLGLALNSMLAQIEQAFARRQASEDKLRRFLAQASHELLTPLSSIRGYAELFRRGAKDRPEDLELAMRRIEQEAARMGLLVDELLLLARLDEGRALERERVDLARVAADAVADALAIAPGQAIAIEAPSPVPVVGDDARLHQMVANLVGNAIEHAGPEARVDVRAVSEGDHALLVVHDDGAGMPPGVAERAFEPFFRPGRSRSAGQGKAGLGLSIVAAVVEAHDGTIELETAPGEGSRFTVRLPLTTTVEDRPASAGAAAAGGGGASDGEPDTGDGTG